MNNNEVEAFALFKGISLALPIKIQKIIICRDSMLIIRAIITKNIVGGNIFIGVLARTLFLLKNFEDCS
jgi:ribonuclease HI